MNKKDYVFGVLAGLLIGLLALPVLKVAKPEIYANIGSIVFPFFLIATPLGLMVANYIGRKIPVIWQIGKFGVIGVLNTLLDWGVLAFLTFSLRSNFSIDSKDVLLIGISFYSVYKAVSFIIANINSYFWNKYWTFESAAATKTKTEFLQFFVVSILGFAVNVGIASYIFRAIKPLGGLNFDQWGIIGAAVATLASLVWNFVGYKFIVFAPKNQESAS